MNNHANPIFFVSQSARLIHQGSGWTLRTTLWLLLGASAFAEPGSLDLTFTPSLPLRGFVSVVLQNDQKMIVTSDIETSGVRNQQIRRLNRNGSVDKTFTPPFGSDLTVSAIVSQPDGKILVAGHFTTNDPTGVNEIKRLLPTGALDNGFTASTGTNGWINSMLLQSDGKIWIAGLFQEVNGMPRNALARLNINGSLDQSFDLKTNAVAIDSIALQTDGRIVFDATFTQLDEVWASVLRVLPDGTIDATFSSELRFVSAISLQSDGKILVAGEFFSIATNHYSLDRLLPSGSADPEFHRLRFADNGFLRTMKVQPDDKILVAGEFDGLKGTIRHNLVRLNADGSVDGAFNSGLAVPGFATAIALQADSSVLVSGGVVENPDSIQGFIVRVIGDRYLQFQNFARDAVGRVNFSVTNTTGRTWILQASNDLLDWTSLSTNTSSMNHSDEPATDAYPKRFYRALVP